MGDRVHCSGKYLRLGEEKFFVRGFSYGPFRPGSHGAHLPERPQVAQDFAHMRSLGANCLRVYFPPPAWLLDCALERDLRVLVDVPWEKHRCFLDDWDARQRARETVRKAAQSVGRHPAVLAMSVVNEIPADIVRYHGRRPMARFVTELMDLARCEAPDCLMTFASFPTSEFLEVEGADFCCFNVYLHEADRLGRYLDRLQHIAGNRPLILGEYGIDTLRNGEHEQAELLQGHLRQVFQHGLSGSFVFAYTDDWFTGGHQIEDWAFGVTRCDRSEKLAAQVLRNTWATVPHGHRREWPKVSVVVCSYNGAATLPECLESLARLDYPDYEVVLVDDGSTDRTADIALDYPQVVYHHQTNQGLSVARNVGAELATGEIVAYTDSDCVVDEHWLRYLVEAMEDQQVEAIGGPNITPPNDGWIARCVAASPGNPSHVMLDDRFAEHVPGCNMAFRRSTLLGLGGFDPQFRQAGDDVDMCWRMLDASLPIGYAPGAMVWHHRRPSVKAYARQQKGYGRSEAMVHFKHPQRCGAFGRSSWRGIIYGDGAVGLPLLPERIYHGRFGLGLFQTIYRHNHYGYWSCLMSLEWHLAASFFLLLAALLPPVAVVSGVMWSATLVLALRSAYRAPLPGTAPWWCRPLVAYLYTIQPVLRGWHRVTHLLRSKRLPRHLGAAGSAAAKPVRGNAWDVYWDSSDARGREELLAELVTTARRAGWWGDFDNGWSNWDVRLVGNRWHDITITSATEELGWPRRFTRARCAVLPTKFSWVITTAVLVWSAVALVSLTPWAILLGAAACLAILIGRVRSRRACLEAACDLVAAAGDLAGLPLATLRPGSVLPAPRSLRPKGPSAAAEGPAPVEAESLAELEPPEHAQAV